MNKAIAHRGPDGNGTDAIGHAVFGHVRLAIIDVANGIQPMRSADNAISLTYNGEIYNYRELRRDLEQRGAHFITDSDTEVIIQIYAIEGISGFAKLRGMFAFALWDNRTMNGYLVRDPHGIKPLFYSSDKNGSIVFASEAKAIVAYNESSPSLDESSLHHLMNFRYLPGTNSLIKGISQLAPGAIATWSADTPLFLAKLPKQEIDFTDANTLSILADSVSAHCVADVDVGAYLSGGIDSALITALARRHAGSGMKCFTLNVGDDPNEARNAARSAELLNVANLRDEMPTAAADLLPSLLWHLELPKVNSLQLFVLAKFAAQHVKVVLSGLGGDELFIGYNIHKLMGYAEHANRTPLRQLGQPLAKLALALRGRLPLPLFDEPSRALQAFTTLPDWPGVYALLRNVWDRPDLRRALYGPRMLDCLLPDSVGELRQRWPDEPDPILATTRYEWHEKMVNDLLWQEDRCSMAAGLEVRVPFVDSHVAQWAQSLDRQVLLAGGKLKGHLRTAASDLLPGEIFSRPKSGFQVNAQQFFTTTLAPLCKVWLNDSYTRKVGLFNPQFIHDVTTRTPSKSLRWHYFILYLMVTTHIWVELFENGVSPNDLTLSGNA